MKSGNEAFDDLIRKRLSNAQAAPPEGVFEAVMEKRRKRRLGWFWLSVLTLVVVTTGGVLIFNAGNTDTTSRVPEHPAVEESPAGDVHHVPGTATSFATEKPASQNEQGAVPRGSTQPGNDTNHESSSSSVSLFNTRTGVSNQIALIPPPPDKETDSKREATNNRQFSAGAGKDKNPATWNRTNSGVETVFATNPNDTRTLPGRDAPLFTYPAMMLSADLGAPQMTNVIKRHTAPPSLKLRDPSRFSVEVAAGACFPDLKEKSTTKDSLALRLLSEKNHNTRINTGFSAEAALFYTLNRRFSAGAGVSCASFSEQADFNFTTYSTTIEVDSGGYYILFPFTPPVWISQTDTTLHTISHPRNIRHRVSFTSVSAGGWIRYALPAGRFTIEPQAGLSVNVYTKITGSTTLEFDSLQVTVPATDLYEARTSIGLSGALNATFAWTENLGVFLRAGYTMGLNPFATRGNASELSGTAFTTGGGIRWNFSKRRAAKPVPGGSDIVYR